MMDLRSIQDEKAQLDEAWRKLRYWSVPSRAPERAGALKTVARRRARLEMLSARVGQLRERLRRWEP